MNFPPFWARGTCDGFTCWRWSSTSIAEAQSLALDAAQKVAERFRHGDYPTHRDSYYPNRPFREQVLREIKNGAGEISAVITRNTYGCIVLNTAQVMFVDIDLPQPKPPRGFLNRLLGKPPVPPPGNPQAEAITRIENWTRANSDWGWRLYRTRAGLRLLATQALIRPDCEAAGAVFEALGADKIYRKLCENQKCFRARLTPKPWRCGLHSKPERWPWADSRREQKFQKWEAQYQSCSANRATCELLRTLGNPDVHPAIAPIVTLHDEMSRAATKLELA